MGRNRTVGHAIAGAAAALIVSACGLNISQGSPPYVISQLPPQRELLPDQQVQQVLNRFAFGGRPGDAARVRAMGVDRWVALQLEPRRIDDRATDRMIASYAMLDEPTSEMMRSYRELREARRRAQSAPGKRSASSREQIPAPSMRLVECARRSPRCSPRSSRERLAANGSCRK
jgi:hypothetical protein